MRTHAVVAAALLSMLATPCLAATLTCAVTGAGAANTTAVLNTTAPDGTRMVTWAQKAYGPFVIAAVRSDTPFCTTQPTPADCLPTFRPLTSKEALDRMFAAIFDRMRDNVLNSEVDDVARSARTGVLPIVPQ